MDISEYASRLCFLNRRKGSRSFLLSRRFSLCFSFFKCQGKEKLGLHWDSSVTSVIPA